MSDVVRRTAFSGLILAGILFTLVDGMYVRLPGLWSVLPPCLALGLSGWFWIRGLRDAGRGWRRGLFLTAFAAPMVWLALAVTGGAHDGYEGFQAGYRDGLESGNQARIARGEPPQAPRPPAPNPFPEVPASIQLVSWIILTAMVATLLHHLERRGSEADRQRELAGEARSEALRGKLAPHFIFNALNTLHAQIEANPQAAQATTEQLAGLFRQVLDCSGKSWIPLKDELSFVEAYLGIEQVRLGDRLRVSVDIPEDLEPALVPPLSLQVLAENAIKHGVAPLEQGGEVRIGAEREAGVLQLWVEDPGPGFSSRRGTGTALDTLRQRLARPEDLSMGMVGGRHRVGFQWRKG